MSSFWSRSRTWFQEPVWTHSLLLLYWKLHNIKLLKKSIKTKHHGPPPSLRSKSSLKQTPFSLQEYQETLNYEQMLIEQVLVSCFRCRDSRCRLKLRGTSARPMDWPRNTENRSRKWRWGSRNRSVRCAWSGSQQVRMRLLRRSDKETAVWTYPALGVCRELAASEQALSVVSFEHWELLRGQGLWKDRIDEWLIDWSIRKYYYQCIIIHRYIHKFIDSCTMSDIWR